MSSKVSNSIQDTGIMSGGVAIGAGNANKGLKIKVLFDWKPSEPGGPIPGPFQVIEGGTGISKPRDGKKRDRGAIYKRLERREFEDADDFLAEVRKSDPTASHPINANTMRILEGKPFVHPPAPHQKDYSGQDLSDDKDPPINHDGQLANQATINLLEESGQNPPPSFPEEVENPHLYAEGATKQISVNAYERDAKAREACLQYHGTKCRACEFDFEQTYGDLGRGYIHVHHLKPLSEIRQEYRVDPVNDLRPVCPNCHAMLHRQNPVMSIEELREILQKNSGPRVTVE